MHYLNVNGVCKLRPMNTCVALLELLRRKNFKLSSGKLLTYIRHSSNTTRMLTKVAKPLMRRKKNKKTATSAKELKIIFFLLRVNDLATAFINVFIIFELCYIYR